MEIEVTHMVEDADSMFELSGSRMEHGAGEALGNAEPSRLAKHLATQNPPGWQEVDGVQLPSVDGWADR